MTRPPAVAGQFYPDSVAEIDAQLGAFLDPSPTPRNVIAVVVPHAGWAYSGTTAGKTYSAVQLPDRILLIGPNHRSVGADYAIVDSGKWNTPLGDVPIAEPLAADLLDRCDLLASDARAHAFEHSLEVQLPMLQRLREGVQIVPILIGGKWPWSGGRHRLQQIAEAVGDAVRDYGRPVLLVASTDLNHYEDQGTADIKDRLVLDAVLQLDEDGLMQRVEEVDVSMCGVAATYVVIAAAKRLGATKGELLDHRTSGDATGDLSSVVGYGGAILY